MIKALLLIFAPSATWEWIARRSRGVLFVFSLHLVPLLALTCAFEGYGIVTWGKSQAFSDKMRKFVPGEAAVFEIFQFLLSLVVVLVAAWLLRSFGQTFHKRHTFAQAFRTVGYGLSPLFLLRFADAAPWLSPWLTWAVGIFLAFGVLYHGVPKAMDPDPPQAFGLFVLTAVLVFFLTGLLRFVTAFYLQGRLSKLEPFISDLARRLPF